ncbi:MAG: gamma-glutamyl-gamma-aminobutyrate hydrolase family protein [Bacteroidaceae bacterium]|nr:gamma-glutamyl-gamma-aminobutyrate hydrolase family protein [Bacteroidaceae bacterium]
MKKTICGLMLVFACICAMAQQKPLIGISTGYSASENTASVRYTYVDAVVNAGGIPVLIPLAKDSLAAAEVISRVDGLILSGGEDVYPFFYGEEAASALGGVNYDRDRSDMWLLQTAVKLNKPVLGICRGEQLTNVTFGGTLYQDIPSQFPNRPVLQHGQRSSGTLPIHHVNVVKDSRLYEIMQQEQLAVNSFHHQAIKDVAPGFKVVATAPDGVIEAIEGFPQYNILAIQWHPEYFAQQGDAQWIKLFEDLVIRAGGSRPLLKNPNIRQPKIR